MKAIKVSAMPGHRLDVVFDDGVSGTIDLKSFIKKGIFSSLKNEAFFSQVYITDYSIAWSDELEIDLLNIYAEIAYKNPEDLLSRTLTYAAD